MRSYSWKAIGADGERHAEQRRGVEEPDQGERNDAENDAAEDAGHLELGACGLLVRRSLGEGGGLGEITALPREQAV